METTQLKLKRNIWKGSVLKGTEEKTFYGLKVDTHPIEIWFETLDLLNKAKSYIQKGLIAKKYTKGYFEGLEFYKTID